LWALLAWVRREVQRTFFNQSPTTNYDPTLSSQTAEGAVTGDLHTDDAPVPSTPQPALAGDAALEPAVSPLAQFWTALNRYRFQWQNVSTSGVDQDAVSAFEPGHRLFNFGRLTTTGDVADGIFAGADDVTLLNFARIDTSGLGAAGIFVLGEDARIANFGRVATHGGYRDPTPDVEDNGDDSYSEGIVAIGDRFHITNFGTVSVEGEISSGLVGIGADGLVVNFGRVDSSAVGSSVIGVYGDRSQAVNAGLAKTTADDVAVMFALGEDAVLKNAGRIVATGDDNSGIQGVVADTHLTNTGSVRMDGDRSVAMGGFGDGHQLTNAGLIEVHGDRSDGMVGRGRPGVSAGADIEIVNAGRIVTDGQLSVGAALGLGFFPAVDGTIVNTGVIDTEGDGSAGVVMVGDGHQLTNSGLIVTDGGELDSVEVGLFRAAGVVVVGDGAVENTGSGAIRSQNAASAAVELNVVERDGLPAADTASQLENFGLISAPAVAVLGGAGQESVTNHGRIVGDVSLGDGDDTFVFGSGGRVNGEVGLGGGNDLVRVEQGSGVSRIADFTAGGADDSIDVSGHFSSFEQVQAHAYQRGDDVIINLDRSTTIVLKNVDLGTLTHDDFIV
jgi:hypothetical protein